MNRILSLIVSLVIALAGCKQPAAASAGQKAIAVPPGQVGSQLPFFSTLDLQGHEIKSINLKGKVTLIDFWATWCEPCRKEMPGYQTLFERYATRGLTVIGFKVDVMTDTEEPLQFIREIGVHYPIAVGSEDIRKRFGGIQGLPTTLIYDRHGILRSKVIGFEYTREIEATIKQLL